MKEDWYYNVTKKEAAGVILETAMVSTGLWTHVLNRGRRNSPDFTVHRPAKSVAFKKQWRILWTAHYSQMRLDGRINTGNETCDFSDPCVNNVLVYFFFGSFDFWNPRNRHFTDDTRTLVEHINKCNKQNVYRYLCSSMIKTTQRGTFANTMRRCTNVGYLLSFHCSA